jgi:hypothetical protein
LEEVNGSLKCRIQGFSTENQGDRGDQKQPFDLCYSEIEGETDCSNSGYQVNSEIPLSQTEQEEPATGMLETLGPATDPSKKPIWSVGPFGNDVFGGFLAQAEYQEFCGK